MLVAGHRFQVLTPTDVKDEEFYKSFNVLIINAVFFHQSYSIFTTS